ncbi:MAG TPA: class I SAM-dependent methyltransferase [Gaiellaceae bacterium]|nr:class I SAM-dependent methyltransferase [Gaiellaceae bacterium]
MTTSPCSTLGAGTGKLTRVLARRYARVIAVEPLDNMRAILEHVVPEAETRAGTAEAIPLGDASVDGVFAGQAFHWFRNDDAVAEIARVLRPRGVVCAVWNRPEEPSPLPRAYRDYIAVLHEPRLKAVQEGPTLAEVLGRGPFGTLYEAEVFHEQTQDRDGVLGYASSVSWIASRPDHEREKIMHRLDELLSEGPFTFPLKTEIFWAIRR